MKRRLTEADIKIIKEIIDGAFARFTEKIAKQFIESMSQGPDKSLNKLKNKFEGILRKRQRTGRKA